MTRSEIKPGRMYPAMHSDTQDYGPGLIVFRTKVARSRLEIKVEFYEGAVPLSVLFAFY